VVLADDIQLFADFSAQWREPDDGKALAARRQCIVRSLTAARQQGVQAVQGVIATGLGSKVLGENKELRAGRRAAENDQGSGSGGTEGRRASRHGHGLVFIEQGVSSNCFE
jgi:hypothetical protein